MGECLKAWYSCLWLWKSVEEVCLEESVTMLSSSWVLSRKESSARLWLMESISAMLATSLSIESTID